MIWFNMHNRLLKIIIVVYYQIYSRMHKSKITGAHFFIAAGIISALDTPSLRGIHIYLYTHLQYTIHWLFYIMF
jgi:hypothetical protein